MQREAICTVALGISSRSDARNTEDLNTCAPSVQPGISCHIWPPRSPNHTHLFTVSSLGKLLELVSKPTFVSPVVPAGWGNRQVREVVAPLILNQSNNLVSEVCEARFIEEQRLTMATLCEGSLPYDKLINHIV
mmetsp:Transcript_5048/g.11113  ORF Transcript_5048/g.11113 Transcript_5048/m.11113 type:complete len:134 (-) Transcript_5048:430-831(-)